MSWEVRALGDLITLQRGYDLPTQARVAGNTPIISSSGISGFHDEPKENPPGVVTGRYGTIGEVFYIAEPYWPLNTTLFVKDFKENNPRFIAYLLECLNLKEMNAAGAVPGVNRNHLHKIKTKVPTSRDTQDKISAIVTAYDDLIENNLQRIKLLEEMAQITYEEWFVRMKFPGHETTKIDAKTGLPEGWKQVTCFDAMEVLSGGTPKTDVSKYWDGTINFFTPKDATNGIYTQITEKKITTAGLSKCNSKLYPKDTLFITARGTVGKLNLAHEPMAMNQSCYALKAKHGLSQYFLYCSVNNAISAFKGAANGGVFDAIVVDTFKFLPFVNPSNDLAEAFTNRITPVFNLVFTLLQQNALLREARDILLPRLMTGMIDVDKVEVPEVLLERVTL